MTITLPDVDTGTAVEEPVPCQAIDWHGAPACQDVAVWDLMLACPDGAVRVRHACARHGRIVITHGRAPCAAHAYKHDCTLVAAYPRGGAR